MKKSIIGLVTFLVTAAALPAQGPEQLFTRPALPTREVLDRLHMKMAWRLYVPMDGRRDGLFSVQVVDKELFIQTRSGLVACIEAETGVTRWQELVGTPYNTKQQLAFNASSVFVTNGSTVHALDRKSGQKQWELELPTSPITSPAVSDDRLYIILNPGTLAAYAMPNLKAAELASSRASAARQSETIAAATAAGKPGALQKATAEPPRVRAGETQVATMAPVFLWDVKAFTSVDQPPMVIPEAVVVVDTSGLFFSLSTRIERQELPFTFEAPYVTPLGRLGDIAYLAAKDDTLYAVNLTTGRLEWRLVRGGQILYKPESTEEDIYISRLGDGMSRIDRATGEEMWRKTNGQAFRYLASNKKFVYALDRGGRLIVVDRQLGSTLSTYDIRDYVFPISNEYTDRLYLGANDGLVVCLHDRDYATPLWHRKIEEPAKPGKPGAKPAAKPMDDKPADKPTDKPGADDKPADKPKDKEGDATKKGDK
jgi:outer membrane protein assembly factor BamB